MDIKTPVVAASAAAIAASIVTLWAVYWWPAWFVLVPLWIVALAAIVRPWKSDAPAQEPLDFA